MRARTARWVAGCVAVGSLALMVGGVILAYADRHLVPANVTSWDVSDVFADVVNMAIPVMGFVLASKRPGNRIGWLALAAGMTLGLGTFADQYWRHALVLWTMAIATLAFGAFKFRKQLS